MPIRSRVNSFVPSDPMIDFKTVVPTRRTARPNANLSERQRQIIRNHDQVLARHLQLVLRHQTTNRFAAQVHVGLRLNQLDRATFNLPAPTSDWHSRRIYSIPVSAANLSINMNPRLWRDHSYSAPGFPRPTIRTIADCQFPIADSECNRKELSFCNRQSAIANRQ